MVSARIFVLASIFPTAFQIGHPSPFNTNHHPPPSEPLGKIHVDFHEAVTCHKVQYELKKNKTAQGYVLSCFQGISDVPHLRKCQRNSEDHLNTLSRRLGILRDETDLSFKKDALAQYFYVEEPLLAANWLSAVINYSVNKTADYVKRINPSTTSLPDLSLIYISSECVYIPFITKKLKF